MGLLKRIWDFIDKHVSIRMLQLIYIVLFCFAAIAFTYR